MHLQGNIYYHNSQSITKWYVERALGVRVVFAEVKAGATLEGSAIKLSLFSFLINEVLYHITAPQVGDKDDWLRICVGSVGFRE